MYTEGSGFAMSGVVKWDPFGDVVKLYEDIDSLFTEFLKNFSQEVNLNKLSGTKITLQFEEKNDEIIITGEIPNAAKDSVDVVLTQDSIKVSGETAIDKKQQGAREYHWSKFTRVTPLPAKVKSEKAKVNFDHGKLLIRVPKA